KQGQTVDTATYKGGTIISDGDVHLTAHDAKKNGITLTGESVSAQSISVASASDINIEAGKKTEDEKNDYKSSGWSAGASIS
ncbi:hemagglutinin repeat-containing protein, partial [Pseudomonas protegens]|nr:hemagglutinin repeat-containing protein [Pseudomonas protegens]